MRRILKLFMVIALVMFIIPFTVYADTDIAKANNGLIQAGYDITVNENMEGSGFVAGNRVIVNNEANGILFAAGNDVDVKSKSDYMFVAGSILDINESVFKDGFVAGSIINLNNVAVERDLYVAGQKINLTGNVGRNLFIAGENVTIDGVINDSLYVDATTIVINSNTKINGTFKYNDDADITISKDAVIGAKTTYVNTSRTDTIDVKELTGVKIVSKLLDTLFSLLNILIVGLLMVLLIPSLFNKLKEITANRLLPSFAWGLLILVATPIVALIALITYIGIATGLLLGTIYGILLYVGTIFSVFVITSLILKDKVNNPYLILLIGLPCLYIIKLIPFVGGLVSFALVCLGLGLLTNLIKRK